MGQPQKYIATNLETWTRSDRYHNDHLIGPPDASLVHALATSEEAGLPQIGVSEALVSQNYAELRHLFLIQPAYQGRFLQLLAKSIKAKRILEVGTLGGYSTIWLGRALPEDGQLITLELSEQHAKVAQKNIVHAGLSSVVKLIVGPAIKTLPTLQPTPPFDLVFIDADKDGNLDYFKEAKRLVRSGGVILVDNVVRYGRVADPDLSDDPIEGVRRLLQYIKDDPTVEATTMAMVGEKGYDGFLYAYKL